MSKLAALAAALWASAAAAQDIPTVISPLRVETDLNNVNLVSGKTTVEPPVLSVPGAPNLRFDRVQNAAPYVVGKVSGEAGEIPVGNWSVHTGQGSSEAFACSDWMDCDSVTGTGSSFRGPAGPIGSNAVFKQAGTGATWHFTVPHTTGGQTRQSYLSNINYPTGETISYAYESATGGPFGFLFRRPVTITSNLGFFISISYQSDDFNSNLWGTVREAAVYNSAAPTTPLGRLTYAVTGGGAGYTVTDLAGRVFSCTGCNNALGMDLEVTSGSMQLPGETAPALQVTPIATPAQPVVASITRDGVTWNYAYTNLRLMGTGGTSYLFDRITVTGPNGYNQVYNMIVSGQRNVLASAVDSINRTTQYQFDSAYRPTRVTYPEGNQVSVLYDTYGNIVSRTETPKPGGGSPITQTAQYTPCPDPPDPVGNNVLCYRPIWSRDGMGRQTDYVHNSSGQWIERLDPADANGVRRRTTVVYDFSPAGIRRRIEVRVCADTGVSCGLAAPIRTLYQFLGDTNLPTLERHIDAVTGQMLNTIFSYDPAGRLLSTDGPLPGTDDASYNRYDVLGRRTWEIGPSDDAGVRLATRTTYRAADDRVLSVERGTVTDPNSPTLTPLTRTDSSYDSRRNPARQAVSAAGTTHNVTDTQHDEQGRLVCTAIRMNPAAFGQTPGGCALTTYSAALGPDRIAFNMYDAAGQLLQEIRAYGVTTANGFPATLQQNYATYTYSPNGRRLSVTDANGNRAEMTWDGFDRQRRWIFPSPTSAGAANPADYEEYSYDDAGNRTSLRKRDNSVLSYTYDNLNRLLRKTVPQRAGLDPSFTRDVFYAYDLRNQPTEARFDSLAGDGVANVYDGFGRLASTTSRLGATARTLSYQYDAGSRRTRITHPDGNYVTTDYDAATARPQVLRRNGTSALFYFSYYLHGGPLTVSRGNGASTGYWYDGVERLSHLFTNLAEPTHDANWTFTRNPADQIASQTRDNDLYAFTGATNVSRAYQSNGLNQYTNVGGVTHGYDANGNLTSDGTRTYTYDVENRLVTASGGVTLRYDPLGRLQQLTAASGTTTFLHDGDALVGEYNTAGTLLRRYVHGSNTGTDDPLLWYEGADLSVPRYLHADHQGSIVAVSGPTAAAYAINSYDEYGVPAAANQGRFQYTGQIWLPELGMYYYKARMYSPTLGRFPQTDPVGYEGGFNLYGYVGNDPVNMTDPTGEEGACFYGPSRCNNMGNPVVENFLSGVFSYPRDLYVEIRHDVRLSGLAGREAQNRALLVDRLAGRAAEWISQHQRQALEIAGNFVSNNRAFVAGRSVASFGVSRAGPAGVGAGAMAFTGGAVRQLNRLAGVLEANRINTDRFSDRTLGTLYAVGGLGGSFGFNARTGDITATVRFHETGSNVTRTVTRTVCNVRQNC